MSKNPMPRVEFIPVPMKGKSILCGIFVWMFIFPKWRLIEDWRYRLPDENEILIPKGFVFDGASVPRLLWPIFSPFDLLFVPGLIHDYAYQYNMLWGISDKGLLYEYRKGKKRKPWDELFRQHLDTTVTLYDLTNTYFEGEVPNNGKAHHGHSKEKRSDCPLVTLGLVVDGSGFVRSSQTFAGNVAEAGTLASMLTGLNAPPCALVVMDAGIASEANIDWLKNHGYRYLVVSRERTRHFSHCNKIKLSFSERFDKLSAWTMPRSRNVLKNSSRISTNGYGA